jgi:hypothetical protein
LALNGLRRGVDGAGYDHADKLHIVAAILRELDGYVVVPAAPLMAAQRALVNEEPNEAYHQLRTAADPVMSVALGNDGNHWKEWEQAERAKPFAIPEPIQSLVPRFPPQPLPVRQQAMDVPSKPIVVAAPEPVTNTVASREQVLTPGALAIPCECAERMGNDFYFLPSDRCLRPDGCTARVVIKPAEQPLADVCPSCGVHIGTMHEDDCAIMLHNKLVDELTPGAQEHSEVLRSCGITPEGDGGEHACVMEAIRNC